MQEAGVGDWVTKRQMLTPDKLAVIFGERQWTYRRLNERVNQAARLLPGNSVS
jgi:fatty-acyl-CoA synthase